MTNHYRKVGLASLILMASVFLSRVIGLIREMVIAYIAGAGGDVDAYQIAFVLPEILNHLVASGFLSVTFIPIFSGYLVQDQEEQGWHILSVILTTFGSLLVIFMMATEFFAPLLVPLIAPGLQSASILDNAIHMTRIIIPAQFFFFAGGLFMAVQFAKESFLIPALAPLLYNLGIIAGGLALNQWIGMQGFAWGVLGGAFLGNFALQYVGARRKGMKLTIAFDLRHPDFVKFLLLTIPLMLGLTMTFSTEIFLKFFGSYLPEGGIAALNYGLRIMFMLVAFFGQAVGMASFPFLSKLAARRDQAEMNRLLNQTLQYLAFVIPIAVLIIVLRVEVVQLLFQRGRFDTAATTLTAGLLQFLCIGAFAFACQTVVVRGFYAMQNTLLPAVLGTVVVLLSIPLYWIGLRIMGAPGVALAISASSILQVWLLFLIWNKRTQNAGSRSVYRFYLLMILISVPLGFILDVIHDFLVHIIGHGSAILAAVHVSLTGLAFLLILLPLCLALRIKEISDILNLIRQRLF